MPLLEHLRSPAIALAVAAPLCGAHAAPRAEPLAAAPGPVQSLADRPVGRVERAPGGAGWRYQWPGTYFEARFAGTTVYVDLGGGRKHARVSVDGRELADLLPVERPWLRIGGLAPGEHQVRVDIVSESQAGVQTFGGFAVPQGGQPLPPPSRARAIEFIGDSITVGYAAASTRRDCSEDEVWRTTDASLAFGALVARHFDADYRLMAVSGRGMVRNFGNFGGEAMPDLYARRLPAEPSPPAEAAEAGWSPQVIVLGLGTNDFSTPVGASEPWHDAAGLAAAFEARSIDFVQSLHRAHPQAAFVLLATDADGGEALARRVRARLAADGIRIGEVVPMAPLNHGACNWHPAKDEHEAIARRLTREISALEPGWNAAPGAP
jgi:lysophospholipase L1-like esterase